MASLTKKTETKRARRERNAGQKRKRKLAKSSTASYENLFAGCGEPGKPVAGKPAPVAGKPAAQ